ncbi:MAG: helix-turn-helix domain-containing protein [Marinifilaceae bacterium]
MSDKEIQSLKLHLEKKFEITQVNSIQEAWWILKKKSTNIILCNTLNGVWESAQLCINLKINPATKSIPVILIGKVEEIDCIKIMADEYMSPPLNYFELKLKIDSLLNKEQIPEKQTKPVVNPSLSLADIKFLQQLQCLIADNLQNQEFNVLTLCKQLFVSRSYLHKRLIKLTGTAPGAYIREFRIKKAQELMISSDLNVTEIAFEVGFNSPRYFRQYFKEKYGMSPSTYINIYRNTVEEVGVD